MLPPFHGERMRAYERGITEVAAAEIATWPTGTEFPLHPSMQAITLEVIMRAVFGVTDPARRDALRDGLIAVLGESASPAAFGLTMPVVKELPHYRRFAAKVARTDELLAAEIAERRADPELESREDILSMLVSATFDDGSKMSDAELRDQLLTLLLAGHETTATALAWTFDLLLHTPPTLDRLVAELDADEGAYLDAVIDESLRVRPVVPMTGRLLREPATLAGYELAPAPSCSRRSTCCTPTPRSIPTPSPSSPSGSSGGPETYSWIPFGGGTRRCIGAAFAELELRIVLREVLTSVRLAPADPRPQRMVRRNVTLTPAAGTPERSLGRTPLAAAVAAADSVEPGDQVRHVREVRVVVEARCRGPGPGPARPAARGRASRCPRRPAPPPGPGDRPRRGSSRTRSARSAPAG